MCLPIEGCKLKVIRDNESGILVHKKIFLNCYLNGRTLYFIPLYVYVKNML